MGLNCADLNLVLSLSYCELQGGFDPSKISGGGTNFGLLVHVLPGPKKQREAKKSALLS
jgi:hypothetical protein